MAIKYISFGNNRNALGYDDSSSNPSIEVDDPIKCNAAPSDPAHVLRQEDLGGLSVAAQVVVDIDDPSSELSLISGNTSTLLIAFQATPGPNIATLYIWDSGVAAGEYIPYVVAGSSGNWIAIGGKYNSIVR